MHDGDQFGLKRATINAINEVLGRYSSVERVVIYGSRAKGTYKHGSDIDLTLVGSNLQHRDLVRIASELDDLLLPYKIDISLFHEIDNQDLIDHIDRVGQVFFIS